MASDGERSAGVLVVAGHSMFGQDHYSSALS
jgi:hypothetical protein